MNTLQPGWRPPYAYLPGHRARHADDLFDAIKQGAEGSALSDMPKTDAWRFGLAFLKEGYFWEAHEVLEPLWMSCPPNSAERQLLQGIIQLANAGLKRAMGKPKAAERLLDHAERLVSEAFQRGGAKVLTLSEIDLSNLSTTVLQASSKNA